MNSVFESIFLIALALLGVSITIYVLSVTLLRNAIRLFHKTRKSLSTEKELQNEQVRLSDMNKLSHHLENINALSFTNAVTFPCVFFLLAIASSIEGCYTIETQNKSDWVAFTVTIITTIVGIVFLVRTLKAIEEVSIASADEKAKTKS